MRAARGTRESAEDAACPERGGSRTAAATGPGNAATASLLGGPGLWRRAASSGGGGLLDPQVEAAIAAERGSGAAIPEGDRAGLEQHLGFDFSAVRVHTGSEADALSGAVQADAFTTGTDVFFRAGQYDPAGQAGRELLAHELSHVVQQGTGTAGATGGVSEPTDDAEVRAGQAARAYIAGEAGSAYQPGDGGPAGISHLMHAGNRAVATYLHRQHHPAPAAGAAPGSPPVPVSAPTADESAPVELPREGDLKVVFSSGRQMAFELNDLSEFGIGEGKLETPPIPVGEFISVSAAIGSHNPITLIQPTLTLDPVIGSISAAEVAKNRAAETGSAETRTTLGAVAAGAGGIVGGLAGMAAGGIAGATAGMLLGPLGAAAGGVAGAGLGAKRGAEAGGQLAGGASDSVYNFFHGDFNVTARLDQGRISGSIGLHYTPFLRLSLSATGFDWLASISAELQTAMNLTAKASIALSGSVVVLHFNGGRLVRTVFTLTPSASLDVSLAAQARLKLVGSLLNVLEESAGRDQALLSGELTTSSFPLFEIGGAIGAQTSFTFAKGSPMDILSRNVRAAEGATRERFVAGLRASGPSIPLLKKRGALDDKSRTGLSQGDAILMAWHKPPDWYPDYLTRPSADGRGERIAKFPHHTYDNGLAMGVDYWPYPGMKVQYRGGEEPRGAGVARFMAELKEEGIELDRDLAYQADIDHVVDWAFSGADNATNLWPLERGANRSAGTTQNRFQKVWWAADKGQQPRYTAIEEVPAGRWFEIESLRSPGGKHG